MAEYDAERDLFGPKGGWCKNCIKALRRHDCGGQGRLLVGRAHYRGRVHIGLLNIDMQYEPPRLMTKAFVLCGKVELWQR